VRKTALTRRTPLRRTAMARPAPKRIPRSVRDIVLERDQRRCVRCGLHLEGQRYSLHHRKPRGQGGPDTPANLISLCGTGTTGCHGWVEHNRELARGPELGYLLRRSAAPDLVPVLVHGLGLAYPIDAGWLVAA
jgi:hypothetical protein